MKKQLKATFLVLLVLLTACSPALTPPPEGMLETMVAATVQALPTNSPFPTITVTITPPSVRDLPLQESTLTPYPSITPFPTFTFTPTLTETPTEVGVASRQGVYQGHGNFACMVMDQKPNNWVRVKPDSLVYATWSVKNVGALEWKPGHVMIDHERGDKIFAYKSVQDIPYPVKPGETKDIVIVLRAPKKGGDYHTTFILERGGDPFCRLIIGISVR